MATYGYAGDFSSDDDEKVEQYQERMVQTKFDNTIRPSKKQIEDEIENIKRLPFDQEINLNDDILAGLLDYYKTPRGPIVDSTRKLYNKIALRLVRGDQQDLIGRDGLVKESTNGNTKLDNENNNSINIIKKDSSQPISIADTFSSDEEVDVVHTNSQAKKFDSRVVYNDVNNHDEDLMDVDSETPSGPIRETKQVDLPTTDEDEDEESDNDDESSSESKPSESDEELNSESDVIEVTPIKSPASTGREKEAIEVLMAMRPNTPKQAEASIKKQQMVHSTPKDSFAEAAKKPYTRSQRVATRSATRITRSSEATSKGSKLDSSTSSADAFLESKRKVSRRSYAMMVGALLVLLIAFAAYYFRSNIVQTAEPLLRKKLSF
ncbi:Hypothetical predicted protein [Olea europaea subsp. europaea]|uniref:LEM domain-containing protein n=1 Tax=Olea europaea subsp. europaea TaxID=158383 RepID=A0A8S0TKI8_OLEEU|nr:Hypothetical predicted protein [Olea europaea subsp. europaea]